jgi:CRP/FNR family transcriptional regulator, cyclic AMP receptor protein
MIDIAIFDKVPIFSLLDHEARQVLGQQVSKRHFAKGETIFCVGDPGEFAYIVQSGLVHVNQNHIVIDVVEPGGLFGISALLAEASHQSTAVAIDDTQVIEIDRNDIKILLTKNPMAGLDMMTMMEKHLRTVNALMRTRVTRNPNEVIEDDESFGEKAADAVARFGGSWRFVIMFLLILAVYTSLNIFLKKTWDPYPFILLNLFLSMLAAIQAPVIIMSQNRQDTHDRLRDELEYHTNLKAELEIEEILERISRIEQGALELDHKKAQ